MACTSPQDGSPITVLSRRYGWPLCVDQPWAPAANATAASVVLAGLVHGNGLHLAFLRLTTHTAVATGHSERHCTK